MMIITNNIMNQTCQKNMEIGLAIVGVGVGACFMGPKTEEPSAPWNLG